MTALVQRGAAELLEHGDSTQRAELVSSFREQAVHIMHTRDGARIACACLHYGDAKDRKSLLKALKGYVARAATDPHGALVLSAALEAVDDTVLLSKAVLGELVPEIATLARHPHGVLPLLQLLAPRSPRHFAPAQLAIMGAVDTERSRKEPVVRRSELLPALLPNLLRLAAEQPLPLACSPHGAALLHEAVRVASGSEEGVAGGVGDAELGSLFEALAAVVDEVPPGESADSPAEYPVPLLVHPHGARLLKKLAQTQPTFASLLLPRLAGRLEAVALGGAGWVVLALLESSPTGAAVRAELAKAAAALAKSSAPGCQKLSEALPTPAATSAAEAAKAAGKKKKKKA